MTTAMMSAQAQSPASGCVSGCVAPKAPKAATSTWARNPTAGMPSNRKPSPTKVVFFISLPEAIGRPARTRTWNMRFWRPPLYHWSYWPKCGRLLRLLVLGVLAAVRAELGQDQLVGHGPLVLRRRVVPVLAHRAFESDDRAVHVCFCSFKCLEPTTRIELV